MNTFLNFNYFVIRPWRIVAFWPIRAIFWTKREPGDTGSNFCFSQFYLFINKFYQSFCQIHRLIDWLIDWTVYIYFTFLELDSEHFAFCFWYLQLLVLAVLIFLQLYHSLFSRRNYNIYYNIFLLYLFNL